MSIRLHHHALIPQRSSNAFLSQINMRASLAQNRVANLDHLLFGGGHSRKRSRRKVVLIADGNLSLDCKSTGSGKYGYTFRRTRRKRLFPYASSDDGVTINGIPQASSGNVDGARVKLAQSIQSIDYSDGLVQSLHDAARVFELAIKERSSSLKMSWFSTAWIGIDKNAWVKALSYQASVHALLQAASEISSRGDGRDEDINVIVHRSLLRLAGPLESVIREKLSTKQPEITQWFWSEQVPAVVTIFINYFEGDPKFAAATAMSVKRVPQGPGNEKDISLLMLALSCISAITNLGPTKVSCSQFFSMIPDISGRLMEMLVNYVSIRQAYRCVKNIGLRREFLIRFGPQAAACRVKHDQEMEEVVFWVNLIQKQLQRAIHRERIWSRLTTSESIEVLEKDLAVFGFFIALGRCTQSFLFSQGFDVVDEPIEGLIRYLIGGSVLYYPQLASISSYQLYVEVVCEELEWLPFYPGITSTTKRIDGHKSKPERLPNPEAIPQVIDVCSHWIQSFIKYSSWLEDPSNVKAARFISRGHNKLMGCMEELGMRKIKITQRSGGQSFVTTRSGASLLTTKGLDSSFDKALESVEQALMRLEQLLQELHVSSSSSGKEQLKAACSDLEKMRRLKKEAEFLEASFRAKAAFLQQADDDNNPRAYITDRDQVSKGKNKNSANVASPRSRGLWNFLARQPNRSADSGSSTTSENDCTWRELSNGCCLFVTRCLGIVKSTLSLLFFFLPDEEPIKESSVSMSASELQTNEIKRFELLRNELMELEERVQRSSDRAEIEEDDIQVRDAAANYRGTGVQLVPVQKKENMIEKSIDKLKETSTDVWQGTQLLAIDVGAATGLLRRVLVGDELTDKEKQALQRTITDLASVVPIGILMLLPVTAVGHAAMLAAIQRYVPSLIPSTYGSERLNLLRQLEKVKELETTEANPSKNTE